jgi:hypothetical protein
MTHIQLGNIRYNAQNGAFEARVDIQHGGETYGYPCQVAGPVTMNMATVRNHLTRSAIRMSDQGTGLMSRL